MEKVNKTADIFTDNGDVVVISHGKEVFRKPKNNQTVSIAHCIYMAERHPETKNPKNRRENND